VELTARDPTTLAVLLSSHARVGAGCVDERDDRKRVSVRDLHYAHRLPVALGIGHAEVAVRALADVAALLVADQRHRPPVEAGKPGDDRRVVGE
jgi:hypothetical protein